MWLSNGAFDRSGTGLVEDPDVGLWLRNGANGGLGLRDGNVVLGWSESRLAGLEGFVGDKENCGVVGDGILDGSAIV
jgi:hypothetical protein